MNCAFGSTQEGKVESIEGKPPGSIEGKRHEEEAILTKQWRRGWDLNTTRFCEMCKLQRTKYLINQANPR
jgi:hypothetical protein